MHNMTPYEAGRLLGGEVYGDRVRCPGPGHSKNNRSMEVWFKPDAPDGFLVNTFNPADDPLKCKDYVRQMLGMDPRGPHHIAASAARLRIQEAQQQTDASQIKRIARASTIWRQTVRPRGTPVEDYLRSRKLSLGDECLSQVIRFHAGMRAMVTQMRDICSDRPCGIHRTFLNDNGQKIDRKMLGCAKYAAIKLDHDSDVTIGITIGEGIETCLSARQQGWRPVWAVGSAGAIATFPLLSGIESLTIIAEHDDSGANQRAIELCARRYVEAGCEVFVLDPPCGGDLNDVQKRVVS
jgi:hypothetical protein